MTIGLAAYRFVNNDISFNISQIRSALECAHFRADLLCFGEAFLQGFDSLSWDYERDKSVAITQNSAVMRELCALTNLYGVDLLVGYIERNGEELYSSCALLKNGILAHNYRRISVGWKDCAYADAHYCEGIEAASFLYKGREFQLALCGDLWDFPERFKTNAPLLWPVCVDYASTEWQSFRHEYAKQVSQVSPTVLLVNSLSEKSNAHGGAFCFRGGSVTQELPPDTEDILFVDVSIAPQRKIFPIFHCATQDLQARLQVAQHVVKRGDAAFRSVPDCGVA
ncbi:MAG: carbon-nitrogen hydrolase family protein [Treponema sp.]|nr:carbon-nitrogen hydrolase family protein [Treponema sp.]